jgi:hypothetical protein
VEQYFRKAADQGNPCAAMHLWLLS